MAESVPFPDGCFSGELPSYATVCQPGQLCGTKDYSTNPLLIVLLMVLFLKSYFFPRISYPDWESPIIPKALHLPGFHPGWVLCSAAGNRSCVPRRPGVGLLPLMALSDGQRHSKYASGHCGIWEYKK